MNPRPCRTDSRAPFLQDRRTSGALQDGVSTLSSSWLRAATATCCLALALSVDAQTGNPSKDAYADEALKKGKEANAAGKFADAVKIFKETNKLQHNACYDCYMGLAVAYSGLGDARSAEDSSNKALTAATDAHQSAAAHFRKGSVLMRFAGGDAKRLAAAEGEFRQALSDDKEELSARFGLGLVLLKEKKDEEGINELKTLLSLAPTGPYADPAKTLIADPRRARERFAPAFEVTSLQGEKLSSSQLSGKVVILDFWATWCPPCREALPELKQLLKKYPRERLVLISISADGDEKTWKDFIAKKNMDWPQFLDGDRRLRKLFHVQAFPTYLVIDGEGIIQQEIVGTDPQHSVAYRLKDALKSMKELN